MSLWPCSVIWSPTPSPVPSPVPCSHYQPNSPFHILVRPLLCINDPSQIHKILSLPQFLSFPPKQNFLLLSPKNWHSVFCMFIFMPIFGLTCVTPVSVFCNPL